MRDAYQSLLRGERRQHHRRIAQVLEERFPEVVESRPEVLAHHYSEGGEPGPAIAYWGRAGLLAINRMGIPGAVGHFTQARELLRGLPEVHRRPDEELYVLALLGYSQALLQGFDSQEAARTYARVWELLSRIDEYTPQLGASFWTIFIYHQSRAEYSQCHAVAEQVLRHGEHLRDPELLHQGYEMMAQDCISGAV